MLIPVMFADKSPGQVGPEVLDEWIRKRQIISFRRSDGWVWIGFDPIRGDGGNYIGLDRRRKLIG